MYIRLSLFFADFIPMLSYIIIVVLIICYILSADYFPHIECGKPAEMNLIAAG